MTQMIREKCQKAEQAKVNIVKSSFHTPLHGSFFTTVDSS